MYHGLYDQIVSDLSMDNHFQCVRWAIVDVEVGMQDHKIHDIGALRCDGAVYHQASKTDLFVFLQDVDFVCGHNIIHHDTKFLFGDEICRWLIIPQHCPIS